MSSPLYVVCRRGNDSQEAAEAIRDALISSPTTFEGEVAKIFDVKGGVVAWGREIGGGEKGGWPTY
jgi:rhodanese-related sulfurtransferase